MKNSCFALNEKLNSRNSCINDTNKYKNIQRSIWNPRGIKTENLLVRIPDNVQPNGKDSHFSNESAGVKQSLNDMFNGSSIPNRE